MREISLHILDIMENSLAAAASKITIEINENLNKDLLLIEITDNGRGMNPEMAEQVFNPFVTSRTCRKVGLGLPLLKETAKRCNGDTTISSKPGQGTKVTATFQHSHIDRPPLGNIVDTLIVFLVSNSHIDLIYRHLYNNREFKFDTAEIKKELDGVSITVPPVIKWLKKHLKKRIASLKKSL